MDIIISPNKLNGDLQIIPSKSQAHRVLICAAFADKQTEIVCSQVSQDIDATVNCLVALGAKIKYENGAFIVTPIKVIPDTVILPCQESGSTLRFLLPIVGALGVNATFLLEGRLPLRPLSPIKEEMERMGCVISQPRQNVINCQGKLRAGDYAIRGNISSQFITALMLAQHFIEGKTTLSVIGNIESSAYIDLTKDMLSLFGSQIDSLKQKNLISPGKVVIEGDWSNAAFFYAANALGSICRIHGLNEASIQGDRKVVEILNSMENSFVHICGKDIPDLIPILSVVASQKHGALFTDIQRLRFKESDRIESTLSMLKALGIKANASCNTLEIFPGKMSGGIVDSYKDHRIAMSAAIASTVCSEAIVIQDADCVAKSYPNFWAEFARLGGIYEQYLR